MNEKQQPHEPEAGRSPAWDPNEQVGDIYEVEIGPQGIESIEKLRDGPQIWVGSLSDYNNGVLHGEWLDAARDVDEVQTDIQTMLDASPSAKRYGDVAEEWGIFDSDGFGQARVDEHDDLRVVTRIARGIVECGLAFGAWASVHDGDAEALEQFDEAFLGHYDSLEDYVEQMVDDLGYDELLDRAIPESLRPYVQINVESLARDMELSGDVQAVPADDFGVWIFDART